MTRAAFFLTLFAALVCLGAGKPLSISLSPSTATITEGQSVTFTLGKSGGNGKVKAAKVTTSDGSFSASVMPGSSFTVPTKDDAIVNGTRTTITVTATASTGVTAKATITELDNDKPAPTVTWTKCADETLTCYVVGTANVRYGTGSQWTAPRQVTGSILCNDATMTDPAVGLQKECDTDGQVGSAPAPTPVPVPTPSPTPSSSSYNAPLIAGVTQLCWNDWVIAASAVCPAFPAGPHMIVIADEQAVPKLDPAHFPPIVYGEDLYRTVHAGETVIVGPSSPDAACVCGGERHQTIVYGLDGKFIGFLWYDNLR